ncbi:hypothetical protein MGYG_05601 [Nannizzia gypsea CBS 118893]|uniref:Uncharacterized protein n=1 Tax=Arthroderma gypseum (strain ATCC MYA-4604 / CBS 118893) TaxID=535722 RepID=E4UWR1_ARTGP|nr:hypothetical protein MGYG_05601 [Nannizzia gypsea CBS 118893]EFR02604.1 hypothetical protein MGYG_05601 [Nannizzia gypsea CBS 118893]
MTTPTLINLPPPPSDPVTPSDMGPSTPNSGTTSLSALSTVAIKDGHQGARRPHSHRPHRSSSNASETSTTTLDAERADRISRLAGLERLSARTAPGSGNPLLPHHSSGLSQGEYFDTQPHMLKERSTVGSASATESMSRGSLGGRTRTTWASGSDDVYGQDETIDEEDVDPDDADARSTDAFSDEGNASLVGFGEGANSTISGPISTPVQRRLAAAGLSRQSSSMTGVSTTAVAGSSPTSSRFSHPITHHSQSQQQPQSPTAAPGSRSAVVDAQMLDGMTYDEDIVDTTARSPLPVNKNEEDGQ